MIASNTSDPKPPAPNKVAHVARSNGEIILTFTGETARKQAIEMAELYGRGYHPVWQMELVEVLL